MTRLVQCITAARCRAAAKPVIVPVGCVAGSVATGHKRSADPPKRHPVALLTQAQEQMLHMANDALRIPFREGLRLPETIELHVAPHSCQGVQASDAP